MRGRDCVCADSKVALISLTYGPTGRTSGVTDHFALNDEHALALARRVVGTLNYTKAPQVRPQTD